MPNRIDLYNLSRQLLLSAGVVTVFRGYHFPEDVAWPMSQYPVAAYIEDAPSQLNPQGNYAYDIEGQIVLHLWIYTGASVAPDMGDIGWQMMDDLHDAILRQFAVYFAGDAAEGGNTSNTTVFKPEQFEPWYWYRLKEGIIGAELRIGYRLGFA